MNVDLMQLMSRYIAVNNLAEAGREAVILDRMKGAAGRLPALFAEWKIEFAAQDSMLRASLGFADRSLRPAANPELPERPQALREFFRTRPAVLWQATGSAIVGTTDPLAVAYRDELSLMVGQPVRFVYLTREELEAQRATLGPEVAAVTSAVAAPKTTAELDIEDEKSPVVQLVDLTIQEAIRRKASDIHVEPFEKVGLVRYRIDGVLVKAREYAIEIHSAVTSRIKLMAGMDIAEKRIPQDGRIEYKTHAADLDLRVSSTPTNFGETIVLRLLSRSSVRVDLDRGGFRREVLADFRKAMGAANGIILVTGPTGSGKTTTLYGMVNELNDVETKIFTIEDPIEYVLEGIVQIPVRPKVGLTFAAALRAAMRQDPDIIMIGEIRDQETAQIAIQASLTGHLVLATLHTNSAPATLTRLIDMGIEPYNLSATMEAVLAQRLVRRLCDKCARPAPVAPSVRELFAAQKIEVGDAVAESGGCDACSGTGYTGRMGVHEFMKVTETVRQAVNRNAPETELRDLAAAEGMLTLLQDGLMKVANRMTTMKEVLRVIGGGA